MNKVFTKARATILKMAGLFIAIGLLSACGSPFQKVVAYDTGKVLVLPARDVVQNGRPHIKGAGTGASLSLQVTQALRSRGGMKPITTDNAKFGHDKIADSTAAINDAKRLSADYVFIMQLGEFQNAAPMSFRPDFAWLQEAVLYRTKDGAQVWRLKKPWYLQKTNFGNHMPLIGNFAKHIAKSIANSAGPGS